MLSVKALLVTEKHTQEKAVPHHVDYQKYYDDDGNSNLVFFS
jgi:hypothetical protein